MGKSDRDERGGKGRGFEALSPGVEKQVFRVEGPWYVNRYGTGIATLFLRTNLTDPFETQHSKTLFDPGAECLHDSRTVLDGQGKRVRDRAIMMSFFFGRPPCAPARVIRTVNQDTEHPQRGSDSNQL